MNCLLSSWGRCFIRQARRFANTMSYSVYALDPFSLYPRLKCSDPFVFPLPLFAMTPFLSPHLAAMLTRMAMSFWQCLFVFQNITPLHKHPRSDPFVFPLYLSRLWLTSCQLANVIPDENCPLISLLVFQITSFKSLKFPEPLNTSNCVPSNCCFLQKVWFSISSPLNCVY